MTNLHEEVKKRLLKAMVEPNSAWKVLVVDDYSTRIISSLLKMTDLSAANISGTREELNRGGVWGGWGGWGGCAGCSVWLGAVFFFLFFWTIVNGADSLLLA